MNVILRQIWHLSSSLLSQKWMDTEEFSPRVIIAGRFLNWVLTPVLSLVFSLLKFSGGLAVFDFPGCQALKPSVFHRNETLLYLPAAHG